MYSYLRQKGEKIMQGLEQKTMKKNQLDVIDL